MAGRRSLRIEGGTFIFDDGAVGVMLRGANGEVAADVQRRSYAVQKRMKRLAPVWSGELVRGIHVESAPDTGYGPASRIVSDAPHTLVAEVGRRAVRASGSMRPKQRPTRDTRDQRSVRPVTGRQAAGSLQWGNGTAMALTIRTSPHGGAIYAEKAGPAAGSHFMEKSIDAAAD